MTPEALETSDQTTTIICKGEPPLWHLLAILKALDENEHHDPDMAIKIITLERDSAISIPTGEGGVLSGPAGNMLLPPTEGQLTWENCPPGGLVFAPEVDE